MTDLFATPLGALLIFFLRVVDVSMGTLRTLFAVRGYGRLVAGIGFVEVLIWVVAAGHTLQHLDSALHLVGFAGGFATGNYVGIWLESRFALGFQAVNAVCRANADGAHPSHAAVEALRETGYAVTEITGQGRASRVDVLSIVAQRRKVPDVIDILKTHDPDVFVTVEEIRTMRGGYIRPAGRKSPSLVRH